MQVEHKFLPVQVVKECGRMEVYVHEFFTYTTEGGECSASRPGCFTPTEKDAGIARAERDGTRAETRFRLSLKRTSPFKSVGVSVQSTSGSLGVRISLSNAG